MHHSLHWLTEILGWLIGCHSVVWLHCVPILWGLVLLLVWGLHLLVCLLRLPIHGRSYLTTSPARLLHKLMCCTRQVGSTLQSSVTVSNSPPHKASEAGGRNGSTASLAIAHLPASWVEKPKDVQVHYL
jgi:hypothetical protein